MGNPKKKSKKVFIPLAAVVALAIGGAYYYYAEYSRYIKTDDAHVDSDNVAVSAKALGRIAKLYVDEQDSVKQGQLVAELDSTDLMAQKGQAEAMISQAQANQVQAEAKLAYDQENIKVLEVNLARAREDYDRAKQQIAGDVITKEQFGHIKKSYEAATAQLAAAKTQLSVSRSQIASANAAIGSANAQVGVIVSQLRNAKLYAPMDGVIAKRWLLAGDVAQPSQSIYTITNTSKLWVVLFIEESKLSGVHIGQAADFTLDTYPGVTFTGKVYAIGSNTAGQFSLIPANNASGNFTKVTQRVSVKVSIDGTRGEEPVSKYRILSGMSAVVKIIKD
ncbi:HlyD family secretion protein [Acetobacteroides hydrogenigenes]|uniref:Membrane fusion protein (Multidrug efflux system) n=1 Tax=Acetobacteroides hydrogenigenes TaxID=979970 RepID=A0A4R2EZB6_9BACT|nr:HlyD family secretion protein [Acetobacteroides hydrogenigenes]TCN73307.1 membrane fusion protein (multidrug efflux system) [Acetobacteroides hydrogenigenes]